MFEFLLEIKTEQARVESVPATQSTVPHVRKATKSKKHIKIEYEAATKTGTSTFVFQACLHSLQCRAANKLEGSLGSYSRHAKGSRCSC
jgi:hypothetical protein